MEYRTLSELRYITMSSSNNFKNEILLLTSIRLE